MNCLTEVWKELYYFGSEPLLTCVEIQELSGHLENKMSYFNRFEQPQYRK